MGGYIKRLKALWDKKCLGAWEEPSLISQLNGSKLNDLLTKMEQGEVEKMVSDEIAKGGLCESGVGGDQRSQVE